MFEAFMRRSGQAVDDGKPEAPRKSTAEHVAA